MQEIEGIEQLDFAANQAVEVDWDPNRTVDDSCMIDDPIASMASKDIFLELETSLQMTEVATSY